MEQYHSIVPLEADSALARPSGAFGVPSLVCKAISRADGQPVCLRYFPSLQVRLWPLCNSLCRNPESHTGCRGLSPPAGVQCWVDLNLSLMVIWPGPALMAQVMCTKQGVLRRSV